MGTDYSVIAVFGCQSSGKSTLLNMLFGTQFPMMNHELGRQRTTKGVCVAHSQNSSLMVMDLEGTDSKERGEESTAYERKVSLFALGIAEVLIVNIWMNDIGRYNASNYSLLKTVFELNLQLFQREKSKTLLFFVIRDWVESKFSLERLREQMMQDITKIWASLMKPEQFADSTATDFFHFEFFGLAHKEYATDRFEEGVVELKKRFFDVTHPNYVFQYEFKPAVPIDGFEHFAQTIWQVIKENKDLDIPTQREMLAMYRCGEIAKQEYKEFESQSESWLEKIKSNQTIPKLGAKAYDLMQQVLESYNKATLLYHTQTAANKRAELKDKMNSEFSKVFSAQVMTFKSNSLKAFQKLLQSTIQSELDRIISNYQETIDSLRDNVVGLFEKQATESALPDSGYDFNTDLNGLLEDISSYVQQQRKTLIDKLVDIEQKKLSSITNEKLSAILAIPTNDMWPKIRALYLEVLNFEALKMKLQGFALTEEEDVAMQTALCDSAHKDFLSKMKDAATYQNLIIKMRKRFEDSFKYTADRVPRMWKASDDIRKFYLSSRSKALELLDLFFLFRLEDDSLDKLHVELPAQTPSSLNSSNHSGSRYNLKEPITPSTPTGGSGLVFSATFPSDAPQELLLMSQEECQRLYDTFMIEVESAYSDALRIQMMSTSNARVPGWVYLALICLGWNELWELLSRPLLLLSFIAIGAVFGFVFLQGMLSEYLQNASPQTLLVIRLVTQHLPFLARFIPIDAANTGNSHGSNSNGTESNIEPSFMSPRVHLRRASARIASMDLGKAFEMQESDSSANNTHKDKNE